jgi:hypothetical protein
MKGPVRVKEDALSGKRASDYAPKKRRRRKFRRRTDNIRSGLLIANATL